MSKVGGRSFVWTCGMCGNRVEAYAPKNFRTALVQTRRADGVEEFEMTGVLCSDDCEVLFLEQETRKRINELKGIDEKE